MQCGEVIEYRWKVQRLTDKPFQERENRSRSEQWSAIEILRMDPRVGDPYGKSINPTLWGVRRRKSKNAAIAFLVNLIGLSNRIGCCPFFHIF